MKRKHLRWLTWIVLLYGIIGIGFYFFQDIILFHPSPVGRNYSYSFSQPYREINIAYDQETNLNIVQFLLPSNSVAKGVVLYFHGNRINISHYAQYSKNFTSMGYEVWMLDYPGFGKSTGSFSEEKLYDYSLQLYRVARTRFQPGQIIIYGKSFGTCLASQLAAVRDCRYLILETPYYNFSSLVSHWMPFYPVDNLLHYRFPTNEYLPKVTAPILIFHGTADDLIPLKNAEKLGEVLKPGDAFIKIEKGRHNNLNDFPQFHRQLDSLLSK
jgi:pimeloyl-ACP methyl ester carboxylesterase